MASSSQIAPTAAEVYRAILTDMPASSEVFVAGLAEEPTAALVAVLADLDEPPNGPAARTGVSAEMAPAGFPPRQYRRGSSG